MCRIWEKELNDFAESLWPDEALCMLSFNSGQHTDSGLRRDNPQQRVSCLVQSNRRAEVLQVVEILQHGYDRYLSEHTVHETLMRSHRLVWVPCCVHNLLWSLVYIAYKVLFSAHTQKHSTHRHTASRLKATRRQFQHQTQKTLKLEKKRESYTSKDTSWIL